MKPLHRIAEVRKRENVSLRTIARKLGMSTADVREWDGAFVDMRLSDLYRASDAIGVPASELLCDRDHDEVQQLRSLLLRVAKITNTLLAHLPSGGRCHRLAESINNQIQDVLPDTEGIGSLQAIGQRRPLDDYGRAFTHAIPVGTLSSAGIVATILTDAR